jgi:hypothetical protein
MLSKSPGAKETVLAGLCKDACTSRKPLVQDEGKIIFFSKILLFPVFRAKPSLSTASQAGRLLRSCCKPCFIQK